MKYNWIVHYLGKWWKFCDGLLIVMMLWLILMLLVLHWWSMGLCLWLNWVQRLWILLLSKMIKWKWLHEQQQQQQKQQQQTWEQVTPPHPNSIDTPFPPSTVIPSHWPKLPQQIWWPWDLDLESMPRGKRHSRIQSSSSWLEASMAFFNTTRRRRKRWRKRKTTTMMTTTMTITTVAAPRQHTKKITEKLSTRSSPNWQLKQSQSSNLELNLAFMVKNTCPCLLEVAAPVSILCIFFSSYLSYNLSLFLVALLLMMWWIEGGLCCQGCVVWSHQGSWGQQIYDCFSDTFGDWNNTKGVYCQCWYFTFLNFYTYIFIIIQCTHWQKLYQQNFESLQNNHQNNSKIFNINLFFVFMVECF